MMGDWEMLLEWYCTLLEWYCEVELFLFKSLGTLGSISSPTSQLRLISTDLNTVRVLSSTSSPLTTSVAIDPLDSLKVSGPSSSSKKLPVDSSTFVALTSLSSPNLFSLVVKSNIILSLKDLYWGSLVWSYKWC